VTLPVTGSHSRRGPAVLAMASSVPSGDDVIPIVESVGGLMRVAADLVLESARGPVGHCRRWRLIGSPQHRCYLRTLYWLNQ
jgi:hypothetical protein